MPTSRGNGKPEAQETRGPQPGGPTPCGLNEMAAGGMASLLMTQPVLWAGVVAGIRQANPNAFQKLTTWPTRRARTGSRALRSFHFFSL